MRVSFCFGNFMSFTVLDPKFDTRTMPGVSSQYSPSQIKVIASTESRAMLDVEGFILVGGASSRMGSDKSQLTFGRLTAVERIAAELRSVASDVSLVGSRSDTPDQTLRNIPDLHPRWGALGGIHAALNACQAKWAAIVACDLPFVTREVLLRLLDLSAETEQAVFDAVVPVQADSRLQPLCALYRPATCRLESERLIVAGEHTPRALLRAVRTRRVEFRELADLPGAEHFFLNVNTPDDYELAKQVLDDG
jgi:molybdopterin-guanine dinucleotide biosynthesis protein A